MRDIIGNRNAHWLMLTLIFCSQSAMFRELVSAKIRVILIISTIIMVRVLTNSSDFKRFVKIDKKQLYVLALLIICIFISGLFNGLDLTFDLYTVIILCVAFIVVSLLDFKVFIFSYVNVMTFLAASSLVIYVCYKVEPEMFSLFPNYNWHGGILKNCFLCIVQVKSQHYRNFGIFVEPGMYSVFLVFALMFSLFIVRTSIKKILILFISLFSTFSTSGYICGVVLIICFILEKHNFSNKEKKEISLFLFFSVSVIVIFMLTNKSAFNFLIDKLYKIPFFKPLDSSKVGSGYERWRAVVYALEAFRNSPIYGIGRTGWNVKFNSIIATATPLNWFGLYGIVYGLTINFFYSKNASIVQYKNETGTICRFFLTIVLFMNIFSQNMENDLIVLILIFYQISGKNSHFNCKLEKYS